MNHVSCGIVGLPNVGKSTLFNALLKRQVAVSANYPFTTIEPNVGVVEVPDDRLLKLQETVEKSEGLNPNFKIIPAVVKFVDIAGLVKGAHKGEGLGNQFLPHIREVDAIVFVVRDFKNGDIVQTGSDPVSDLEVLKSELMLKDLETLEKRVDSFEREIKPLGPSDPKRKTLEVLVNAKKLTEQGKWLSENLTDDELDKIQELSLLSAKKFIIVVNSDEVNLKKELPINGGLRICAKTEEELSTLSSEEQKDYLKELGLEKSGLERLIIKAYEVLNLISFFTAGPKEIRAWTTSKGARAPQAAGVIHTDFEKGFIAADVINWKDLVGLGGWQKAKAQGKINTIGKSEEIKEGMVVEFKFSV